MNINHTAEDVYELLQGNWIGKAALFNTGENLVVEPNTNLEIAGRRVKFEFGNNKGESDLVIEKFAVLNTFFFKIPLLGYNLCFIYEIIEKSRFSLALFHPNPWNNDPIVYQANDLAKSKDAHLLHFEYQS